MLNFAIQIARDAGQVLAERFGRTSLQVSHKGDIDLVTESDLAAEQVIIERIRSYHPRHAILSEEAGASTHHEEASEYKWIVDPLDGTTNYAHGYPCFCVSIALERAGEIITGVIYDPMRDEMFAAERGAGATLNARSIRVSETDDLSRALLCTGFPYDVRERGDFARHFTSFIHHAQGVRRDGSAALDLAYVAAGRFDGFWEEGLRAWDVAAGKILIEEAGGLVTHYDGRPFDVFTPPLLASNGLVHKQMMGVLAM
ncbi:MAG: inositol monophosphatase [Pyrinomonadaceae bacterium]|nr:inositol monophosphatase [Pyrinomonadaceae bacterium]